METDYTYDALNDLLTVAQNGVAGVSVGRPRSFTDDSLSRLLIAANPEAGTICYGIWSGSNCVNTYDANGNLTNKTDARNKTVTYAYDALNRLTQKASSDGAFVYTYKYDSASQTNAVGRLTAESNNVNAAQNYNYDVMGRVTSETYCTPQNCGYTNAVSAGYDLAGNMTSLTYPDGRVVQQVFDSASHLTTVNYQSWNGETVGTSYLSAIGYDPVGHPTSATMGNGVVMTGAYNTRLEPKSLGYANSSSVNLWNKTFLWTKNGNLEQAADTVAGTTRQYNYDTLNRLIGAQDIHGSSTGQTTDTSDQNQSNTLANSQAIGSGGWFTNYATLTPNVLAAPDGSMTAGTMVAYNQPSIDSYVSDSAVNPDLYDGAAVTGSVWLRVPSGTLNTYIMIINIGDQNYGIPGATAVTLTTTWQQFFVSATNQNGLTSLQFHIGGSSTVANGQEIDIWGPQLGPTPSSSSVTNYVPYSQQIGGASWNQYCAANSSNMTLNTTDVTAPDGSKTATSYVTPNTSTCGSAGSWGAFANVAGGLSVGQTYTASIWLKGASGGEGVVLGLNDCANTNVTLTTSWRRYTYTASTIPSSVASCELGTGIRGFQFRSTNSTIYAWGAQLETASTAGPYVATLDSPITAPIDSTNFLESSDQINGNGWEATTGMTVAQTTAISAPDSSNTAYAVSGTSTNSELTAHIANPGLYDGAQVTASVYLSVPAGSTLSNINISLINGTAAGSTTVVTQSVSLSSNWQRFSITGTNLNGLTGLVFLIGGSNTLPANQTIYVWGGQMVMGASPGALIPTQNTTTNNSNGASTTLSPNGLNMAFSYDAFGNMISSGNFNFQQSYTTANQLSGWAYDPSGNLVNDGLGNTYAYDAEGKITGVGGYTYVYDADGNRVSKSGSTAIDHFYFGGREVATLSGGQWTDLIYGTSGLLAEVPGTQYGAPTYRMMDQLGTQVGTLDPSGVLLSLTDYAPFGQVFNGGSNDPYKFTGKERDTESGNDYFGARYYGSSMGRFMSPDWAKKPTAVPYADFTNPQTLNLYQYMRNNPLGGADKDGHCDWCQKLLNGITGNGFQTNAQLTAQQQQQATVTTTETYSLPTNPQPTSEAEPKEPNGQVDLAASAAGVLSAAPGVVPGAPGLLLGLGAAGVSSANDPSGLNLSINATGGALGVVSYAAEGTALGTGAAAGGFGVAVGAMAWSGSNWISTNVITPVFTPDANQSNTINANGVTIQAPAAYDWHQP